MLVYSLQKLRKGLTIGTRQYVKILRKSLLLFTTLPIMQINSEGKPGIALRLSITVLNTNSCSPISDALVDLWHCDSVGVYSHYIAESLGERNRKTDNSTFFRGKRIFLLFFFIF